MEAWAQITLAVLTVVASIGATIGAFGQRVKRTEEDIGEIKTNYKDRFDRLEKINMENFRVLRDDIHNVGVRLDGMMTKADHDRICKWNPPTFTNPQGR